MVFVNEISPMDPPTQGALTLTRTIDVPTPPISPPLPFPRTISELISYRARQLPSEPILGYPSQGIEYVEYTHSQLDQFSAAAAFQYGRQLPLRPSSSENERVVAILGPSNLDYFITTLALSRLGFTVLFLSTRISDAAYVSLLNATKCKWMVADSSFRRTASGVQTQISELLLFNMVSFSEYALPSSVGFESPQKLELDEETTKICWIIHSSGSTGLPKPIYQTHQAALRNYENNMNMRGLITLPLFHAHGLSSVFRAITSNKKIFMYNASLPLTRQNLLEIMHRHRFDIFYGVPYALKLLSENLEGVEALAAMQVVMFGGSACPDALGDLLVNGGVNLISHYGTTETGQLMTSFRPREDKAWNYVRVHDKLEPFVRWEERGANMFELVVLEGWPSKVASNRDDGAYATKDLFEPHSTTKNAWKYAGRLDDTIVLMNGEKAIPIAMEQSVRQSRLVKDALIFGSGKARIGMMVVASDSSARMSAQELIEAIWPLVERENQTSPAYAQLSPDMVSVLPAGTVYPQTDKGTVIRQAFYRTFQQEIEEVYRRLEASATGTLVLTVSELRSFLRTELMKLLPGVDSDDIADETDLFSLGVDSLQSARLRGTILQQIQLNGNPLCQNVVFENPTITKLADALIALRKGAVTKAKDVKEEMEELVSKYGTFPKHLPQVNASESTCVVVTGATGSLGAHIVAQLVTRDNITEVCCLVRASSESSARHRVIRSLRERALLHRLPLSARRKITSYSSDFSKPKLGLNDRAYEALAQKITTLIHCAWSVNFNKSLSSFEADCIAGAKNLMLLCLAAQQPTPASFNFCSSVSTVANTPGQVVPEALPESLACAQGMGYAQSKLVTENLVVQAALHTGMRARVLRVGQIIADTAHGIWNDTEAIPLMLQAATTIGALPALDENPRWLPVDTVARAVLDISLSSNSQTVFNVVNPATFHWTRDLLPALTSAGLTFEEVDQREWVRRLRSSNPDPVVNPTFKLIDFFASKYDTDVAKKKSLNYMTAIAECVSPALASRPQISQDIVTKFVRHFLRSSWAQHSGSMSPTPKTRLLVFAGPCGSGKSTLASLLADHLGCSSIEGDSVHDAIAISKMCNSIALSPLDREIWLARLRMEVLERIRASQMFKSSPGRQVMRTIILTCSALKREHRGALRELLSDGSIETQFIVLQADEQELIRRVEARKGHYMKAGMVASQLAVTEEPMVGEVDVFPVDVERNGLEGLVEEIAAVLGL